MSSPSGESDESDLPVCSVRRALDVIGEQWTLLILREVLIEGEHRAADIAKLLEIPQDLVTNRLESLALGGVLEARESAAPAPPDGTDYYATPRGNQLKLVLAALQEWGDEIVPPGDEPTQRRVSTAGHRPARLTFVDDLDQVLEPDDVTWENTSSYPTEHRESLRRRED